MPQAVFGIFLANINAPAGTSFSFCGSSQALSCIFPCFEALPSFLLPSTIYRIQRVTKPLTGEAMTFPNPPIISKRVSRIQPEVRLLHPHLVLFWRNAGSVKAALTFHCFGFFLFSPLFGCFCGRNRRSATGFSMLKAKGLQWAHQLIILVGRRSGRTSGAIPPHWPRW